MFIKRSMQESRRYGFLFDSDNLIELNASRLYISLCISYTTTYFLNRIT
jgi:hypothetical protein